MKKFDELNLSELTLEESQSIDGGGFPSFITAPIAMMASVLEEIGQAASGLADGIIKGYEQTKENLNKQ